MHIHSPATSTEDFHKTCSVLEIKFCFCGLPSSMCLPLGNYSPWLNILDLLFRARNVKSDFHWSFCLFWDSGQVEMGFTPPLFNPTERCCHKAFQLFKRKRPQGKVNLLTGSFYWLLKCYLTEVDTISFNQSRNISSKSSCCPKWLRLRTISKWRLRWCDHASWVRLEVQAQSADRKEYESKSIGWRVKTFTKKTVFSVFKS